MTISIEQLIAHVEQKKREQEKQQQQQLQVEVEQHTFDDISIKEEKSVQSIITIDM